MIVFDRPPLGFVEFPFLTDLGRLQCRTARCLAEISSEFPDDGGASDGVREVAYTRSNLVKWVSPVERQNENE